MKLFLILALSMSAFGADRIIDRSNLLEKLDNYLAAPSFEEAFYYGQETEALQKQCQYQLLGRFDWRAVNCTRSNLFHYYISDLNKNEVIVGFDHDLGRGSYRITRAYYRYTKGNHARRMIDSTHALEAEIVSLEKGKLEIDDKEISTRILTVRYLIPSPRGMVEFEQEITLSKDVPYISQIIDFKSHDLRISLNQLLGFKNEKQDPDEDKI